MKEVDNFLVIDKSLINDRIKKLKILRNKAIEEESFETAQWFEGKIDSLKLILVEGFSLENIIVESFDKGWELCGKINVNYKQSLDEYLSNFKLKQTHD